MPINTKHKSDFHHAYAATATTNTMQNVTKIVIFVHTCKKAGLTGFNCQ